MGSRLPNRSSRCGENIKVPGLPRERWLPADCHHIPSPLQPPTPRNRTVINQFNHPNLIPNYLVFLTTKNRTTPFLLEFYLDEWQSVLHGPGVDEQDRPADSFGQRAEWHQSGIPVPVGDGSATTCHGRQPAGCIHNPTRRSSSVWAGKSGSSFRASWRQSTRTTMTC